MADTDDLKHDVAVLIGTVQSIHELLKWIVTDAVPATRKQRVRDDPSSIGMLRHFRLALPSLAQHVDATVALLSSIQSKDDERWRQLEAAGLTGVQLNWKSRLLEWVLGRRRPLRRLLKWANNFLGSLAKVFANAEVIKEFKEGVELFVERQSDLPDPPRGMFSKWPIS